MKTKRLMLLSILLAYVFVGRVFFYFLGTRYVVLLFGMFHKILDKKTYNAFYIFLLIREIPEAVRLYFQTEGAIYQTFIQLEQVNYYWRYEQMQVFIFYYYIILSLLGLILVLSSVDAALKKVGYYRRLKGLSHIFDIN